MYDQKHAFVYQLSNGELRAVEVKPGIATLTRIQVSGLPQGAEVALGTTNGQPLRPGQPAHVVNQ